MAKQPSNTQRTILNLMDGFDGFIHREPGGFWVMTGDRDHKLGWCDIRTIRAMEKAGWIERTNSFPEEWRDTRRITEAGRLILETPKQCGTCNEVHVPKKFYNHNFVKKEAQNASREEQHGRYLDCGPQNWDDR